MTRGNAARLLAVGLAAVGLHAPPLEALPPSAAVAPLGREPRLVRSADGEVRVTLPGVVLADPAVERQLLSGLTTTLVLRLEARDPSRRRAAGAGRIDVRFELWDEVYLVTAFAVDGRVHGDPGLRLAGRPELERHLASLALPTLRSRELDPHAPWTVELALDVLPFSLAEQRDAQRWFSDTVASQRGTAGEVGGGGGEENRGLGSLLDLVMATSLERRAVTRFAWRATVGATGVQ